ncbi:hypothetical protein CcaverHIS002_0210810 [Cutaneotrichosporon cavernicola]|uniref:beta-glucosidase n=1 Tax=Cutaneotrichosporon cavernicola TaxID=279322 RepID=A0AA48KYS8_9TREE|nr:uncharacterized protein CcaverHIS019_0210810 [Cutaneotrichosporon cavernicola]BEI81921.1 hypothetical protein CcaverHIS002_0210810 [Cutaneotrichosporon cavernicola]BEI89719.1 hypothetical protein CcaverHIS019_0210810 [Cutaneotrichosporon cavernicola]BEI97490.1 hypothetical protein CcaverHIS631_0210790 [Cutaneotrichosporon cavernicola]BEJ05268.1 hypothetical protein CcaverHIS641_0210850 [Cutaneotrichosporon cavernicola]
MTRTNALRKDFIWGFATAAAQIEGGGEDKEKASGRGPSIWDYFCDKPGKIADGSKVNDTCDFYTHWKEDLAMMKNLGANSYRFSISWPRVIPLGGKDDPVNEQGLQFYSDVIDECLRLGMTPFVTLYHWDLPLELYKRYGGWLNKERSTEDFVRYARLAFERYGDRVKDWITFNEPWVIAALGHSAGAFAPGHISNTEPWIVGHSLLVAHAHAAKVYHDEFAQDGGVIGITLNGDWAEPYDSSPENIKAAQDKMDAAVGWFADPVYLGTYPESLKVMLQDRLPEFTPEEIALLKDSSDFYGCNFYTTNMIKAGADDEVNGNTHLLFTRPDGTYLGPESQMGWLRDVPWGFRKHLNYLYKRYGKPIYITENGYAVKGENDMSPQDAINDTDRVNYFEGYLGAVRDAIGDGVDIRSYFAWSCYDNFEWASGFTPRFGCVRIDYETKKRTVKDSGRFLGQWFEENISV